MSTEIYEQAIASTRAVLAGVTTDQLEMSTPCSSWDVSGLINHVVGVQYYMQGGREGTAPTGQDVDYAADDYMTAFDVATSAALAAFSAEGALEKTVSLPFGDLPGGEVMKIATNDLFAHGWDLARATGQSTDLAPELADSIFESSKKLIPDTFRGPEGAPFGPVRTAPEGASKADQLAAFLGREV